MGHSNVRCSVRRRKVAQRAKEDRKNTTRNNTIPKPSENLVMIPFDTICDKLTRFAYPKIGGKVFRVDKNPDKYGLHYHRATVEWPYEKHKQTKSLRKRKKGLKPKFEKLAGNKLLFVGYEKYDYKSEYPVYTLHKMNKAEYMEKLVEHKVAKWERKHPCPVDPGNNDLFEEEFMKPWLLEKQLATERIRDFVISVYDKLPIMGNKLNKKDKRLDAVKIDEVKDIDGKGHDVSYPKLKTTDKLYQQARDKAQAAMDKNPTIIDADLMNHKRNQKRPLDVKRNKSSTLADVRKKYKKAA